MGEAFQSLDLQLYIKEKLPKHQTSFRPYRSLSQIPEAGVGPLQLTWGLHPHYFYLNTSTHILPQPKKPPPAFDHRTQRKRREPWAL